MQPGISAIAADMPSGAVVQSGKSKLLRSTQITSKLTRLLTKIRYKLELFFCTCKGGRVDFNVPTSDSSSLNRVLGSTPSSIAGQINSNGKVILAAQILMEFLAKLVRSTAVHLLLLA